MAAIISLLCDFGDEHPASISGFDNYDPVCGDYRLIFFDDYEGDSNGKIIAITEKYTVLNVKTGE